MSRKGSIFYAVFFLSGATGLVYQVIWVRLMGLVYGNTSHAISIVLSAFMTGLALGSWKLGQMADRTKNPLRLYGVLEIGIGISAGLVPLVFRLLNTIYWGAAPSFESIRGGGAVIRRSISNSFPQSIGLAGFFIDSELRFP